MVTKPDGTPAQPASMRQAPALSAPTLMPRRLFHLHGAINRRKVLAAATSGIAGVILGERLLAPLRAEAQPRGLFPWLSGGGGAATAPSGVGAGGGGGTPRPLISTRCSSLPSGHWATISGLPRPSSGGGAQVQDLGAGKTLAWISYWNYGTVAHLTPSGRLPLGRSAEGLRVCQHDPRRQNVLIYGLPPRSRSMGCLNRCGAKATRSTASDSTASR